MRVGGDYYGIHRVLRPAGVFPQAADRLDASLPIYDNEILILVDRLHIDSASFCQLWEASRHKESDLKKHILEIVRGKGKMHNPVTHSGGTLLGTIGEIGKKAEGKGFKKGERVATLISLTLTPLYLDRIDEIDVDRGQLVVKGHAVVFEAGGLHRLPPDFAESVVLDVFDVCGAPALVSHIARVGETVIVLGAGKSGILVAAEARKKVGRGGRVFVLEKEEVAIKRAELLPFIDSLEKVDLSKPHQAMEAARRLTDARMADLVVNCVNIPGTEMASILAAKRSGTVLFFNMATSFQAAVLGAEGIGHETRLIMGNGYTPGHADLAIHLVRETPGLKEWFEK